jgi:hypothetical protein
MTPTQHDSIQADKLPAPKQIAVTLTERDNHEYTSLETLAKYNLSKAKHMYVFGSSPHVSKEKANLSLAWWVK